MTENLIYVTRVESVVYEMFNSHGKGREMKAEKGKTENGEEILST
jgi:hypothetical protein